MAVARSLDGERFETLTTIGREEAGAESLERPALLRTPDGGWRLYLSCATYGTKHWRVEVIEARDPARFDIRHSQITLAGDAKTGVKDPVIIYRDGLWHLWAACHPLEDPAEADQMVSDYATSVDGRKWTWHGTALSGRPGQWDSRGARITAVHFAGSTVVAYYDGRASAADVLVAAADIPTVDGRQRADRARQRTVRPGAARWQPALPHGAAAGRRPVAPVLRGERRLWRS